MIVHPHSFRRSEQTAQVTSRKALPFLNLTELLLYLPSADQTADNVTNLLRGRDDTVDQVTFVLNPDSGTQESLHSEADDRGNLRVAPSPSDVTRLLLARRPLDVLAELIASQVSLTRISPFQTGAGVNKESIFSDGASSSPTS